MKTLLILISLISLTSCGPKQKIHKSLSIHPESAAYVQTFEERMDKKIDDLKLTYAKDSNPARIGYCAQQKIVKRKTSASGVVDHIYQTPLIVINTDYWNDPNFTKAQKEQVIFHELGHCIEGRGHSSSPMSIMYAYALSAQAYLANYAAYMGEFFGTKYASSGLAFDSSNYALTASEEEVIIEETVIVEGEEMTHPEGDECVHDHGTTIVVEEVKGEE